MSMLICTSCGTRFEAAKIDAARMASNPICPKCANAPAKKAQPEPDPKGNYFKEPGIEVTKDKPRGFERGKRGSFGG